MTADQIRAEIARLQQMLQQIEGGGENLAENQEFLDYLKSQEQKYLTQGRLDYFRVEDGKLVFDPNLASASEREYQNFLRFKERSKRYMQEKERKEKERLFKLEEERLRKKSQEAQEYRKKVFESNAMNALRLIQEDPSRQIASNYIEFLRNKGLLPAGYGQPAPTPQPVPLQSQFGESESPQTGRGMMPPAWS